MRAMLLVVLVSCTSDPSSTEILEGPSGCPDSATCYPIRFECEATATNPCPITGSFALRRASEIRVDADSVTYWDGADFVMFGEHWAADDPRRLVAVDPILGNDGCYEVGVSWYRPDSSGEDTYPLCYSAGEVTGDLRGVFTFNRITFSSN